MIKETLDNKTLLVCGGAGFIGSNFIKWTFGKFPKVKIINLDKLTYSGNLDNVSEHAQNPNYVFIQGDIADPIKVASVFDEYKPDYVINFAAETHVDRSIHIGAREFIVTNIEGVFNLLENLKRTGSAKKFVQVSTDEVYGSLELGSKKKFQINSRFSPNVPYAATKAGGDLLCNAYSHTWKVPVVVTHCTNNYGPFQYPEKLIPFFTTRMMENKKLPIYGDGKNVRDWIYVEDHCEALLLCLQKGKPGETYNIGADNELNNLDIAKMILKYFKRDKSWIEFIADRPGHDRRYAIDSSKIKKELGWKPKHKFKEAFQKTIDWYIENQQWIDNVRRKTGVFNPHIDLWEAHNLSEKK